jgi:hypothetical protein
MPPQQQLKDPAADLATLTKQHKGVHFIESNFPPDLSRAQPAMAELVCKNWVQVNPIIYQI